MEKKGKLRKANNPYQYLAFGILEQALYDIRCFYSNTGTPTERHSGRLWISWINNGIGTFKIVSLAIEMQPFEIPPLKFHHWCMEKLEVLKTPLQDAITDV